MQTNLSRRHALTATAAGAVAALVPASASAAGTSRMGPNDVRLWELYEQWQAAADEQRALSERSGSVIDANVPADLRAEAIEADKAFTEACEPPRASDAVIEAARHRLMALNRRQQAILDQTELGSIEDAFEQACGRRCRLEEAMSRIVPDSLRGTVPLLRAIEHAHQEEPAWAPHMILGTDELGQMAFNIFDVVRRQIGEAWT